jgi:hypothetical protein
MRDREKEIGWEEKRASKSYEHGSVDDEDTHGGVERKAGRSGHRKEQKQWEEQVLTGNFGNSM